MIDGVAAAPGKEAEAALQVAEIVGTNTSTARPDDEWESTHHPGLIFKLRKMSRMALVEAGRKVIDPKVPVVWIEDKQRNEPNPNDPDYREELSRAAWVRSTTIVNTCLVLGTKLLHQPEELDALDSQEWLEQLDFIGIAVPEGKYSRYAAWVRYYALDDDELTDLVIHVQRFNGVVTEQDVQQAAEEFKSSETRDTDNQVQPQAAS
jgi:hypothetical protein